MGAVLPGGAGLGRVVTGAGCGVTRHDTGGTLMHEERSGWVTFAAVLFLIAGTLDVIYGIAAIGDSSFLVRDTRYVFSDLNTWGWITVVLGLLQVLAAGSLWRGGLFGRVMGVGAAAISAIGALLSIPAYPFWSLAIFALDIVIIHQVCAHGREGRGEAAPPASSTAAEWDAMAQYKQ
jgi:hypothetical protein